MTSFTRWLLRRACSRSRSQTVSVVVRYPKETRSSPSSCSAASASADLLAAALSSKADSCLAASSLRRVQTLFRFCHHCFRYFSISDLASALSRQRKRVTHRYSTSRWFKPSRSPGRVEDGNPVTESVQRKCP